MEFCYDLAIFEKIFASDPKIYAVPQQLSLRVSGYPNWGRGLGRIIGCPGAYWAGYEDNDLMDMV